MKQKMFYILCLFCLIGAVSVFFKISSFFFSRHTVGGAEVSKHNVCGCKHTNSFFLFCNTLDAASEMMGNPPPG